MTRLNTALERAGKDLYVDWEDIPDWSPDYERELFGGIDAADSFLFVLSPESSVSPNCRIELEHASANGKRIRPLLRREVDAAELPEALRRPQWLDFRRDDEFERAVARLLDALNVDAEWVHAHTRIGLRATEWQRRGRDASYLLRGSDLRDAETWLVDQAGKEPPPTAVQLDYLTTSRRASSRRQRAAFAAVVFALAVAVVLALFALLQRNQARDAQRAAERGQSQALAAQALATVDGDPAAALQTAVRAAEVSPTRDARTALRVSLAADLIRATLHGHSGRVDRAGFSRNGKLIVTSSSEDGTARVWDVSSGRALQTLRPVVETAAISPNGKRIVTAGADGRARVVDVTTGRTVLTLRGHAGVVEDAEFSPNGSLIVTAGDDGTARVWSAFDGHRTHTLRGAQDIVQSAIFSPDGRLIVTTGVDRVARIWDARSGRLLHKLRADVLNASFSPRGDRLVTTGDDETARIWDGRTARFLRALRGHTNSLHSAEFSPDGRMVVTASVDGTARIWDAASGRSLHTLQGATTNPVVTATFSPDGRTVVTAGADAIPRIWDARTGGLLHALRGHSGTVWAAGFSPDGSRLVTAGDDGTVRVWSTGLSRSLHSFRGQIAVDPSSAASAHGQLATARGPAATIWNVRTGERLRRFRVDHGTVRSASLSDDGRLLVTATGQEVHIWNAETGRRLRTVRGHIGEIDAASFSADTRRLVARGPAAVEVLDGTNGRSLSTRRGTPGRDVVVGATLDRAAVADSNPFIVRIWDLGGQAQARVLRGHTDFIWAAAFSPDDTRVLTTSDDGTARIWDASSGRSLHVFHSSRGPVSSPSFSPSGDLLMTVGDGAATVWDASGQAVYRFGADVSGAAFSGDGNLVFTVGDGTTQSWSCSVCGISLAKLLEQARERVRALS